MTHTRPPFATVYHRDQSVTIWDVFAQSWLRLSTVPASILATLPKSERARVIRHTARNFDALKGDA
jgi:hypothetical protein